MKPKSTHGGAGRGQGRKPLPVKQKSYSFRCYPSQMEAIRKLIKEFKENHAVINCHTLTGTKT
jgi:hypothetical protein